MVLFNYATRELTAKIVYYGPGLCGKTTNLQYIHQNLPGDVKGKMLSLATKTDRTLFFDFLPIDLGEIRGMKTRVQLYTVPGQVFYNETRKLVLKGADGIVFVADSQEQMVSANVESFRNLEENLKAHGMTLSEMPHVIQFNKRDLPNLAGIEQMNGAINRYNAPFYESVATTGIGVQDTLKAITKLVLLHLTQKYDPKSATPQVKAAPAPTPAAAAREPAAPQWAAPSAASAPRPQATAAGGGLPLSAVQESAPATGPAASPAAGMPSPTGGEPVPDFGEQDIDRLMDEVDETELSPPTSHVAAAPAPAPVEDAGAETISWEPEEHAVTMGDPGAGDEIDGLGADGGDGWALETSGPAPTDTGEDSLEFDAPEQPPAASPVDAPADSQGSGLEIDLEFDPDHGPAEPATPSIAAAASTPPPTPPRPDAGATVDPMRASIPVQDLDLGESSQEDRTVLLTEAVEDDDLFADPDLEVARLTGGDAREIVVPVVVGEGGDARRFRLSITLRLDPAD